MATATPTTLRSLPTGRTLHLLDVENLAGTGAPTPADLADAVARYRAAVRVRDGDHVLIGCDVRLFCDAGLAWPGARLCTGRGPDGADRALLDATDPDFTATHYDRVVVGSGDHAFTDLVLDLRDRRVAVCVAARRGSLARTLRGVAGVVLWLDEPEVIDVTDAARVAGAVTPAA